MSSHPFLSDAVVWTLACASRLAELEGTRVVSRSHYGLAEALYRTDGASAADPLQTAEAHCAQRLGTTMDAVVLAPA